MTTCQCGQLIWFAGALSVWSDGVLHRPDAPCTPTDDLSGFGAPVDVEAVS